MFDTIAGLPLHPLVVHATEVVVPTAALVLLVAALWPRFRRWAGLLPFLLTLAAVVLVPISSESGEALEHRVGENALIETHSELAEELLPWAIAMVAVAAVLLWWNWNERTATTPRAPKWVAVALAVAAVLATTGTTVQAIRIGHSGATAVWSQDVSATPAGSGDED
ncbi:DUF2231 domain-containing protein [Pengzhenrongella frigida]|uniref:DUF2231 domain-containing protein n=1 Tax=Pengzhenrongella frigida TaxID=1259133 RepID=A0A4Q5N3H4_9MICO|nr:DUF2231 domain-containing protein [Cellulomonas sp. HLT2-17]RYV52706.1 hypothetical protein EUA98_01825 [Cellulomonas sp. HLT2-17]